MHLIHLKVIGPAAAVCALLVAGACALPFLGAARFDREAASREEMMVARNVPLWIAETMGELKPWGVSDEVHKRLSTATFDARWIETALAPTVFADTDHEFLAVLPADDAVASVVTHEEDDLFARNADLLIEESGGLVRALRSVEATSIGTGIPQLLGQTRFAIVEGTPVLIAGILVQKEFDGVSLRPEGPSPILLVAMPVERRLVRTFSLRLFLEDMAVEVVPVARALIASEGKARASIWTDGRTRVQFTWNPARPGEAMLHAWLPLMLVSLGVVVLAAVLALLMSRRTTTALLASQKRLVHAASHDVLTGLLNRREFGARLSALSAGPALTVATFDLDHFKPINDRHGHAAGDAVLVEVARRMTEASRPGDLVFRLGGDEFALILPGLTGEAAAERCRAIVEAVARPIRLPVATVEVGACFGLATVNSPVSGESAMMRSDAALYRAKARRGAPGAAPAETRGVLA